jgi:hypothetical protein
VHSSTNHPPLKASLTLCHPERTRISCFTALLATTYVVLPKENHMQSTEAATLDRKSGEAEGSAVRPSGFPNSGVLTQTLQGCDSMDNLSAFLKRRTYSCEPIFASPRPSRRNLSTDHGQLVHPNHC